jgi:Tol biopolymer transport system component
MTTIWLASVTNPELRRALTTVVHKVGYGVQGAVSPDGSKVAYLVIPPDTSERAARTAGGELWVVNVDGTDPHRIAENVGWVNPLTMWSPDSHTLVFGRRVPVEFPVGSQMPLQTELYIVTTDGTELRLLLSDDTAHDIQPVGWSADGRLFYYARWANLQDRWDLWKVDVPSGSTQFQIAAPSPYAQGPILSPDGTKLIFTLLEGGQRSLLMLSIDGRDQRMLASGATADQPLYRYVAIWSPDSQSILAHIPPKAGQPAQLEQINLRTGQRHTVVVEPVSDDEFFIPQSWSPDGAWLVILKYPRPQSLAYLMRATGGPMVQIPLGRSSNWVTLLGWTMLPCQRPVRMEPASPLLRWQGWLPC